MLLHKSLLNTLHILIQPYCFTPTEKATEEHKERVEVLTSFFLSKSNFLRIIHNITYKPQNIIIYLQRGKRLMWLSGKYTYSDKLNFNAHVGDGRLDSFYRFCYLTLIVYIKC